MIISLFGPDGVGKSTVARRLEDEGLFIFSGTGVASWPDKSWIDDLNRHGVDEPSLNDDAHFLEKIERCHKLARALESRYGTVVIDSDPFHKTVQHDYMSGRDRFDELFHLAYPASESRTHVHLTLSGDSHEQARKLQYRLHQRGELAPFDPRSIDGSQRVVMAFEKITNELIARGEKVIHVIAENEVNIDNLIILSRDNTKE